MMTSTDRIKTGLLLALLLGVFAPVYPELVRDWMGHSDNSHGFIVPIMAGYFLWQKREALQRQEISPAWGGFLLLLASLLVYLVSYAGGTAFTARVAFVGALVGMLWFLLGTGFMRQAAFPILFLLFMIPVPYSIISLVSMPLQLMATTISTGVIQACQIPVSQEGNMLYFVGTQLEVAEACSGIRSIMAMTMLATAFAYMSDVSTGRKAILCASAIPIAMVGNILRISGTGILAHFFGDGVARGFLHEASGIVVFVFGMVMLMLLSSLLKKGKNA